MVMDATADIDKIASSVDFVFCAVDMKKDEIRALEEEYARHECPVVSNNSAHRFTPDVPMVVPEINPEHLQIIPAQRKRLGIQARLYCRQVQLLPPVLCARHPSSAPEVRHGQSAGVHISGHLRRRKNL